MQGGGGRRKMSKSTGRAQGKAMSSAAHLGVVADGTNSVIDALGAADRSDAIVDTTTSFPHSGYIVDVGPQDVLFGRGTVIMDHHGNVNLRNMIRSNFKTYDESTVRGNKKRLCRQLIDIIKSRNGRFLRRLERNEIPSGVFQHHQGRDVFLEVNDDRVLVQKMKQSFRYMIRSNMAQGDSPGTPSRVKLGSDADGSTRKGAGGWDGRQPVDVNTSGALDALSPSSKSASSARSAETPLVEASSEPASDMHPKALVLLRHGQPHQDQDQGQATSHNVPLPEQKPGNDHLKNLLGSVPAIFNRTPPSMRDSINHDVSFPSFSWNRQAENARQTRDQPFAMPPPPGQLQADQKHRPDSLLDANDARLSFLATQHDFPFSNSQLLSTTSNAPTMMFGQGGRTTDTVTHPLSGLSAQENIASSQAAQTSLATATLSSSSSAASPSSATAAVGSAGSAGSTGSTGSTGSALGAPTPMILPIPTCTEKPADMLPFTTSSVQPQNPLFATAPTAGSALSSVSTNFTSLSMDSNRQPSPALLDSQYHPGTSLHGQQLFRLRDQLPSQDTQPLNIGTLSNNSISSTNNGNSNALDSSTSSDVFDAMGGRVEPPRTGTLESIQSLRSAYHQLSINQLQTLADLMASRKNTDDGSGGLQDSNGMMRRGL